MLQVAAYATIGGLKQFEARIEALLEQLGGLAIADVRIDVARDSTYVAMSATEPNRRVEIDEAMARGLVGRGAQWRGAR